MSEFSRGSQPTGDETARPVSEAQRVESLDVLRGFALLGILPLNILGFGLHSAAYFNPTVGLDESIRSLELGVWAFVDVFFEGAMRCLFSMLFGAGVVLFATGARAKSGFLHYRRTFWLLMFGLFDAYVLLWTGDILILYAVAGALLYLVRNWRARNLLILAVVVLGLTTLIMSAAKWSLSQGQTAAAEVAAATDPESVSEQTRGFADAWTGFAADNNPSAEKYQDQLRQRSTSYASAFPWNAEYTTRQLLGAGPVFLLWDALGMMLIGMAFFKLDLLQGGRSRRTLLRVMTIGFLVGMAVNLFEVVSAMRGGMQLLDLFSPMRPTYQLGRLGMACGYLGLIVLIVKLGKLPALRSRLAPVGRMALTNYLMHSAIALFLFTGAGLGLVGQLSRWQLLVVVLAIWILQLLLSPWWLKRYRFGPLEWLWRALTYWQLPALRRRGPATSETQGLG